MKDDANLKKGKKLIHVILYTSCFVPTFSVGIHAISIEKLCLSLCFCLRRLWITGLDGFNQAISTCEGITIDYEVLSAVNNTCLCRMIHILNITYFLQICQLFGKGTRQCETTVLLWYPDGDNFLFGSYLNICE